MDGMTIEAARPGSLAAALALEARIHAYWRARRCVVRTQIVRTGPAWNASYACEIVSRVLADPRPANAVLGRARQAERYTVWMPWRGHNARLLQTHVQGTHGLVAATPTVSGPKLMLPPNWGASLSSSAGRRVSVPKIAA